MDFQCSFSPTRPSYICKNLLIVSIKSPSETNSRENRLLSYQWYRFWTSLLGKLSPFLLIWSEKDNARISNVRIYSWVSEFSDSSRNLRCKMHILEFPFNYYLKNLIQIWFNYNGKLRRLKFRRKKIVCWENNRRKSNKSSDIGQKWQWKT